MKRRTQYFKWGRRRFSPYVPCWCFTTRSYGGGTLQQFVTKLSSVLAPVLYGCAIAYLLTPVMSCLERAIAALWKKLFKKS